MIQLASRPVAVMILALTVTACSEPPAPIETPPPSVSVYTVEPTTLTVQREFIGRVTSPARVDIRAQVSGILEQRSFEEGGAVNSGDVLYEIERDTYQALVDQAKAKVESDKARANEASISLKRIEKLEASGNVSEQNADEARATAQMAQAALQGSQAALEKAELDLDRTHIVSPLNGRISETKVDAGNLVGPDSGVLATVLQLDPIQVHFTVSDVEYLRYREQQKLRGQEADSAPAIAPRLRLTDNSDYPYPGRIELIANEIDTGTGTLTIRAEFPNPDELLRPGQFVSVILAGNGDQSVLAVPQATILTTQAGQAVLVVGDDNMVSQRTVETGQRVGELWQIKSGLKEGEKVIVQGLQKARPGSPVSVVER